jgi:hypothetical protein
VNSAHVAAIRARDELVSTRLLVGAEARRPNPPPVSAQDGTRLVWASRWYQRAESFQLRSRVE